MEKREQPYAGCAPAGRPVELIKYEEGPTVHRPQPVVDMLLAHRIRLDPTPVQRDYFARAAGTARRVWNWALAQWQRQAAAGRRPNAMALKKQFNAIKYADPDWLDAEAQPWLRTIHRDAHSQPFANLAKAWRRYFAALGEHRPASSTFLKASMDGPAMFDLGGIRVQVQRRHDPLARARR